ncbi:DUF4954 family protein [Sphingobacterium sp. SYP-B4668]|uniref:DUF4954 family protein n=1 Tax=Sphingobacterium sp. SYP-B4668 TaxID=2996035 RepID=UPI0022DDF989|nr:DUF4954 family protein [Sphingobacterium sp. SYP-B4668]
MSNLKKGSLAGLGHNFVKQEYLFEGQNEYDIRFEQHHPSTAFRPLTEDEIHILKSHSNVADDWANILVTNRFIPEQIQNCKFYGLNRIGNMEPIYLEYRDFRLPVGIYNSTIISCDFGNLVAVHEVRYLAHFILKDEVILANINEMETSSKAKFGNGILRIGEDPELRIALELCNENGGRQVWPFDGMLLSDAYIWSRHRHDFILQSKLERMTNELHTTKRGAYSVVEDGVVIKNCQVIKDVKIGKSAYIKGVNKLKNVTIHSSAEDPTQIGEGCELVNGIIGEGCRIFYGVKAVRFILAAHSQLKYGARLINSFLGENSTISCCEVLNSLLFPAHEQHHNNSFLCASLIRGQSNMAAGATVGSNHNSRAPDGEIVAGRGFWPGLCVSLKHNSRFASYTLIVKGDFLYELDIKIPFSLVSNDITNDRLIIIPGYWFLYNMYALARNPSKYEKRDKRRVKQQYYEYDILAPDTINELFDALQIIEIAVARAYYPDQPISEQQAKQKGGELLESNVDLSRLEVLLEGFENSKRKVQLLKVRESYELFKRLIRYYTTSTIATAHELFQVTVDLLKSTDIGIRPNWVNIGGQLILAEGYRDLINQLKEDRLNEWSQVHAFYYQRSQSYQQDKLAHAYASLLEIMGAEDEGLTIHQWQTLIDEALKTKEWISDQIYRTRAKDYQNEFRHMVYESIEEMEQVVGKITDNTFIKQQENELLTYRNRMCEVQAQLSTWAAND